MIICFSKHFFCREDVLRQMHFNKIDKKNSLQKGVEVVRNFIVKSEDKSNVV